MGVRLLWEQDGFLEKRNEEGNTAEVYEQDKVLQKDEVCCTAWIVEGGQLCIGPIMWLLSNVTAAQPRWELGRGISHFSRSVGWSESAEVFGGKGCVVWCR